MKKLLAVAILILFIGMSVTPSSCLPIKQDFTSLAKDSASQIMPYRYSINHKETFFEPEHEKILLQDDDVELLWNTSTELGRHIDSAFINDDDVPDILACNYALDGITGEIIYQFEKGMFVGLGDVNNDGHDEIITSEDDWEGLCDLYCINVSDGSIIWERKDLSGSLVSSLSIGDVTGNLTNEIVVGTGDLYCLNGNSGSIIWQKQAPGAYDHFGCTAISDVNNDGYNEVIAGTSNNDARVFCLEGDKGDVIWQHKRDWSGGADFQTLCIDNFNNDPYKEIVVEGNLDDPFGVFCLSGYNGNILWTWNQERDAGWKGGFQSILSADLIPSIPGNEIIAGGFTGFYCLYAGDNPPVGGRVIWHAGRANGIIPKIVMSASLGDVDGDGLLDVVGSMWEGSGIYAVNGQYGSLLWYNDSVGTTDFHTIRCVDLTNDLIDEVVSINSYYIDKRYYYVTAFQSNFPLDNQAPDTPMLGGPTEGKSLRTYEFTALSSDSDNDDLYYYFDWGDGTGDISARGEPGETVVVTKSWKEAGNYTLRVKAIDEHGAYGNWSDPLCVNIIPAPFLDIQISDRLGVHFSIKNIGNADAVDGNWIITVKGGRLGLINFMREGDIILLKPEEEFNKRVFPLGLGPVKITVTAEVEGDKFSRDKYGFIIFIFIIG